VLYDGAADATGLPVDGSAATTTPWAPSTAARLGPVRASTVSVRLSGDLLDRSERWAADHRWSRGCAATVAIERVLHADA